MKKAILALSLPIAVQGFANAGQYKPENIGPIKIGKALKPYKSVGRARSSVGANNTYYRIELNPFFVSEINSRMEGGAETKAREGGEISVPKSFSSSAQLVSRDYGGFSFDFISSMRPALHAWLASDVVEKMRHDERISSIAEVDQAATIKQSAIYQYISPDSMYMYETTSWGVSFIKTPSGTTSNTIYAVEGNPDYMDPGARQDLNIQRLNPIVLDTPHQNNNPMDAEFSDRVYHVGHVAGIIGAKENGVRVKGVNPGQPIKVVVSGGSKIDYAPPGMIDSEANKVVWAPGRALEIAALDAEANGIFSVVNFSMNGDEGAFSVDGEVGQAIRRASNRLLVVESAGNDSDHACKHSYNAPNAYDGILVVGGVRQDGSRFTEDDRGSSGLPPPRWNPSEAVKYIGSNYGPCVEAWAPGFNITSLDAFDGTTRVSTGTSYAAAFTSALASRYGTNQTRPVSREQFIRKNLVNGIAGPLVRWGDSTYGIPNPINISKVYKEGTSQDIPSLHNGKFFRQEDIYKFGGRSGSLMIETNNPYSTVKGVRLTLITASNPREGAPVTFNVYGGSSPWTMNLIAWNFKENKQATLAPIYIPVAEGRYPYIKIEGTNPSSLLAYSEVEVYGH